MASHYSVDTFNSRQSLGYLLKLAHSRMHDCATIAFEGHDLSFMQWIVLTKLHEGTASTAGDLCKHIYYDTGALTRLLDQLEKRGYLRRQRSRQDRRVVQLIITDTGREKVKELTPLVVAKLNEALDDFTSAEFAEFMRLLNKLIERLVSAEAQLRQESP